MQLMIRNNTAAPIYQQIYQQIKEQIINGTLEEDTMLPSIRSLAKELRISIITTKRAYEELEKEGLIRSVAGKGFYVCESNKDYLKEKQLMMLEKRLAELISDARQAGMSCRDFVDMATVLYEGK